MSDIKQIREVRAVILAGGKGTRMKSEISKMVHELHDRPIVQYVAEACKDAGIKDIYIIIGFGAEDVKTVLGKDYNYVLQKEQLGTGHALMQAVPILKDYSGDLVVLVGDSPFITSAVIERLFKKHQKGSAEATFVTTIFENPPPYGRIIRDKYGKVNAIVEEKDATPEIKTIKEVNTSHYCFKSEVVLPLLEKIDNKNEQQEYYLTDIVGILVENGYKLDTLLEEDNKVVYGINSKEELDNANKLIDPK